MPIDTISNLRNRLDELKIVANQIKEETSVGLNTHTKVGSTHKTTLEISRDILDTIIDLLAGFESISDLHEIADSAEAAAEAAQEAQGNAAYSELKSNLALDNSEEALQNSLQNILELQADTNDTSVNLTSDDFKNVIIEIGNNPTQLDLDFTFGDKNKSGSIYVKNNSSGVNATVAVNDGTAIVLGTFNTASSSDNIGYYFYNEDSKELFLKWN